jgi:mRNA interferase RelE/StbE
MVPYEKHWGRDMSAPEYTLIGTDKAHTRRGLKRMEIELTNTAIKQYKRLNEPALSRITVAINKLELEPPQGDIKKLTDRNDYRLRVGGYRIFFRIEENDILVTNIVLRGQAYKE